jgi:hypothetical protein
LYSFEKCSAWAGWAFANAFRRNTFELCAEDRIPGTQELSGIKVEIAEKMLYEDASWKRKPAEWFRRQATMEPDEDEEGEDQKDTAVKTQPVKKTPPESKGKTPQRNPRIICSARSDLDPKHQLTLCTVLPSTTLLLPYGSNPLTKCYLDKDKPGGCSAGWSEPEKSGVFPKGAVVVPRCRVKETTLGRFALVQGASRKFALGIADSEEEGEALPKDLGKSKEGKGWTSWFGRTRRDNLDVKLETANQTTQPTDFDEPPEPVNTCRHTISQPVWFVERLDASNIFHASEDHSNAFLSLLLIPDELKQTMKNGIQIVLVDAMESGPFLGFWQRLSHPFPLRQLHIDPYAPGTCFTAGALFSIHSERSLISAGLHGEPWRVYGQANEKKRKIGCPNLILSAFARWKRDLFADRTHTGMERDVWGNEGFGGGKEDERWIPDMTVSSWARAEEMWLSAARRQKGSEWYVHRETGNVSFPSVQPNRLHHKILWLSRRAHESTLLNPTSWQKQRMVFAKAEDCGMRRLQRLVESRNSKQCIRLHPPANQTRKCKGKTDHFWDLEFMEPSDLSFESQIERVARADVLIGAHGAALSHAIHLRPGSAVVELAMGGNRHFQYLAEGTGHRYFSRGLNIRDLGLAVIGAADAMRWIEGREWGGDAEWSTMGCD